MKDYTPNGVVVDVVATVVTTNELAVGAEVHKFLLFHMVYQKYHFLRSKKVLEEFLLKS